MIKNLIWLIKHKKEIEKLLEKEPNKEEKDNKNYSTDGVPDFQKGYVEKLLNGSLDK